MSKSVDNAISYTANNYYKYALEGFNNANMLKNQQGLTPLIIANYTTARSQLTEALLFGKIEACAGLALFNQQGIGGPANPYNQKLFLTIGSKFENEACKQALAQLQNNNYNVEKEADIWVKHINTYKRDLDKEITTSELATSHIFLKNELVKNSIGLDAYNSNINVTKTREEIAASSEYDHNITTPYYTPSETPKPIKPVKHLGDVKHSTCEIS